MEILRIGAFDYEPAKLVKERTLDYLVDQELKKSNLAVDSRLLNEYKARAEMLDRMIQNPKEKREEEKTLLEAKRLFKREDDWESFRRKDLEGRLFRLRSFKSEVIAELNSIRERNKNRKVSMQFANPAGAQAVRGDRKNTARRHHLHDAEHVRTREAGAHESEDRLPHRGRGLPGESATPKPQCRA